MTRIEAAAELSIDAAIEALSATTVPITATEVVPTRAALRRVLARDLVSGIDLPNADNAAMDGYAVRAADLQGRTVLREVGRALAGQPCSTHVEPGTAIRIMTGAAMPVGADTVVMLEHVAIGEGEISVVAPTEPGANVRRCGEHIRAGTVALALGTHLRPVDVGLATAVGASELPVFRRLRVGVLSTGDELSDPPAALSACGGYDANRPFLLGGLVQLGFDAIDLGICADQADDFERAAHGAVRSRLDVLLTSGGAAQGDADIVRKAGGVTFVALDIRPGRGIALATLDGLAHRTLLLGLPGNAVAAFLMFHLVARPVILRLAGARARRTPRVQLPLAQPLTHRGGRIDYQRAQLVAGADGRLAVAPLPTQGSAMLQTVTRADALIAVGPQAHYAAGDEVETVLLDLLT